MRFTVATIPVVTFFSLATAGLAQAQIGVCSTNCNGGSTPGPNQAIVYEHAGFGGRCALLEIGMFPDPSNFCMANDSISSVKTGSNVRLDLYAAGEFDAQSLQTFMDRPNLVDSGFNDITSAIRVIPRDMLDCANPGPGQVAFFLDAHFIGECVLKNVGSYFTPGELGLPGNKISSIKFGDDMGVVVGAQTFFEGPCLDELTIDVEGQIPHLGVIIGPCGNWNDRIDSVRVFRLN